MTDETKPITAKARYAILVRDKFACQACGARAPNVTLHVDHVVPRSKGGTNEETNLRAVCITCNLGKSDALPEIEPPPPAEKGKHPLTGWALLSYKTETDDGRPKEVVYWQGVITDVIQSNSSIGDLAVVDWFEWIGGDYTYSQTIPITEFSKPWGSPVFYKLFRTWQERNEYYQWKHGIPQGDD